jgi:glycosyltransferase involved in cell wall biosynthesis
MGSKIIIHISEIDITTNGGMGRVEYNWKIAFEKRGFEFIHIGPREIGPILHKGLFPYRAYTYFKSLKIIPKAFIVHEPASGRFVNLGIPCFLESHGVERRAWENDPTNKSFKTLILYPLWRLKNCDVGLKKSTKLLLINTDDKLYVENIYGRKSEDIYLFKNGVNKTDSKLLGDIKTDRFTILFNGSWIERKGIKTLVRAAEELHKDGFKINFLLIGTGKKSSEVLNDWPKYLWKYVTVIDFFDSSKEIDYLNLANLVVLPSLSEGQPLSLLQAMSVGKCCIGSNNSGQKDFIINEYNGFLFPAGNSIALTNIISKCYNNYNLIEDIGNRAKIDMELRTWENVSNEVVNYVIDNS